MIKTAIGAVLAASLMLTGCQSSEPGVTVLTPISDWIVWGQVPSATTYLGMILVIGGGLVAVRARRAPTAPEEAPR